MYYQLAGLQVTEPEDRELAGLPLPSFRREGCLHATRAEDVPSAVPPAQPLRYPVVL